MCAGSVLDIAMNNAADRGGGSILEVTLGFDQAREA